MDKFVKETYLAPEIEVITLQAEVIFCTSVDANMEGPWGSEENI